MTSTVSNDDTVSYFGLGLNIDENWSVGYTLYNDVGGDDGLDLGLLYAGYRF